MMNKKEDQLIEAIVNICQELNWSIAIPSNEDGSDDIHGLIIGTQDYIDAIVGGSDEFEDFDEAIEDAEDEMLSNVTLTKGKKSFH